MMKFLIYEEGSRAAAEAGQLGGTLGQLAGAQTVRLGATAAPGETATPVARILETATQGNIDLIFIGAHTRNRLTEWVLGTTAARLAKQSAIPLFIVKQPYTDLKHILVCTGGEAPGEFCALWGGRVAAWTNARITLLHVMSQVAFNADSKLDELDDTAEEAIRTQTREGLHLQRAIALAKETKATTEVKPKIRHGLVVDEILSEINEGDYDLVAIGAHFVPNNDPLRGLLLDDLTDQIIAQCPRNVLVVRKA